MTPLQSLQRQKIRYAIHNTSKLMKLFSRTPVRLLLSNFPDEKKEKILAIAKTNITARPINYRVLTSSWIVRPIPAQYSVKSMTINKMYKCVINDIESKAFCVYQLKWRIHTG